MGDPFAEGSRRLSHNFTVVNLVPCRRVRRRNLLAKGCLPLQKVVHLQKVAHLMIADEIFLLFYDSDGKHLIR
ncbi:MAG: hypothetical protein LBK82_03065 [Planctomycetaceae bacterium]|nr:hypothetical protein [Planctomycetaceae bacterium]